MQCNATTGAYDLSDHDFLHAAIHFIGRADKTFMECLVQCQATKWTLLNQVTGKSEAKQKHESSMRLKLTYVNQNVW
jgi:hypothetical protein